MANIPIYPGSSSFFPGNTPFGFYDNDYQFQVDADKVVKFCAYRLGYPLVEIELQDLNFYTAFEEAITTYGNELYAYKVQQDYLSLEGANTGSNLNHALITPNFANIVRLSHQYGEEAGVGGKTTWYRGALPLTASVQDYDLSQWALNNNISGGIEIKKIFYEAPPAIVKYFDPYAGTGMGMMNLMDNFGWGNYSPAINFLMMPINYDLQKLQAIEFNDQIRKSQFSFELINNRLRIFPIPGASVASSVSGSAEGFAGLLYFQYIKLTERNDPTAGISGSSLITNVSNVPFKNPIYCQINSIGRQWIFEYTLSLCKEMLGYVRGKYTTVPIPGAEVTLNQADLLTAATAEKNALIERLRAYFDNTSRTKLMEAKSLEIDSQQKQLQQVPMTIFIG
jgi:hypothetical protein